MSRQPVYRFLFITALALAPLFLLWYLFAPLLNMPVTFLVRLMLTGLWPGLVEDVEHHGHLVEVITTLTPPLKAALPPGQEAVFTFSLKPTIYGYGLPLLAAMSFAVAKPFRKPGWFMLAWLGVLTPVQALAVAATAVYTLAFQTPPATAHQIIADFGNRDGLFLFFKIATLILPNAVPIVLWVVMHSDYIRFLSPENTPSEPAA